MDKLFLVDGSAYFFRAYYALPPLSTSKGEPTNAIFGFSSMLHKLIREKKPKYLAIVFDSKEATFRDEIYEDYKANRKEMPDDLAAQIPYIKRVVEAFKIPVVEKPRFEADDLIASIVHQLAKEKDLEIVVVSSDKDLMQLVNPKVVLYDPAHIKGPKTYDKDAVKEKFGVDPQQVRDLLALMGDSSDNIPGVPGVGPKTAAELINRYSSVENLYSHLGEIKKPALKKNLEDYRGDAELSLKLVTLERDVGEGFKLAKFLYAGPDNDMVVDLFRELEFNRLLKDLEVKRSAAKSESSDVKRGDYTSITDTKMLAEWVKKIEGCERFAVDTETDSVNPVKARLVGVSIALKVGSQIEAAYMPLRHKSDVVPKQVPVEEGVRLLKRVLENGKIKKVAQNIKFDYLVFKGDGITVRGIDDDTMLISYCLNPSSQHNLDALTLYYLNHQNISFHEVVGKGASQITFDMVPLERATPYAAEDADVTLRLSEVLGSELSKDPELERLYRDIELPLAPLLAEMELRGVKIDRTYLKRLQQELGGEVEKYQEKIEELVGEKVNVNSNQQLQTILFDKLGLPSVKRTKSGYSTDSEVLETLAPLHPLPRLIIQYREVSKLKSTYVDSLLKLADEHDRVHTSYNQTIAATGRLSSSNPNLQNIPIRTELGKKIRQAFITEPGWCLLSADYNQVELRLLAHIANDKELIKAFKNNHDIHTSTAAEIFGVGYDKVTEEQRREAKAMNFGIIYGISPFGLSRQLSISQDKAKQYIDRYFERYSAVKEYIEAAVKSAGENGFVKTMFGRRRYLPELHSKNPAVRSFAERIAINSPIQGTAADIIKAAMLKIVERFSRDGLKARLILQVHDELIAEVPKEEIERVKSIIQDEMSGVMKLSVPLNVSIGVGKSWADII